MGPYSINVPLHEDGRGWLMATDKALAGMRVAYAYATCCLPGQRKGWHRHALHTDRMFCVAGRAVLLAFRDGLPKGQIDRHRWMLDPADPKLVVIPPGWWHGFAALGDEPCVIVNCPDLPYDPEDQESVEPESLKEAWMRGNSQ